MDTPLAPSHKPLLLGAALALAGAIVGAAGYYAFGYFISSAQTPFTRSIVVTGEATGTVAYEKAEMTATVSVTNADKAAAVEKVNATMTALIAKLKEQGVVASDLKTQSVSTQQGGYYGPYISTKEMSDDWQATNTLVVTVRDMTKLTSVADTLQASANTVVYGPNYTTADGGQVDAEVLAKAVADARIKAEALATASGRKLGKVVSVTEGSSGGIAVMEARDSATSASGSKTSTPIEPGTQDITKQVTVIYRLR